MKAYPSTPALLPLAGLLSLFAAAPVTADDAPPPGSSSEKLETVVVTAQRREEKLQDVPIAVTAIGVKQLESRGIDNIGDLNAVAPGLQISKTPSNNTISQIAIRGIAEINPAIYWDPAVGLYLDGVYIGKAQGSIFDVVDLNRIEVLRGPQGTLYGRNTVAGAINLVTAPPTGVFDGKASLEIGNYNEFTEKVAVDLPRFGMTSIAFGALSSQRDGWVTTTPNSSADELNNRKNWGFRGAVHFDISPALQADYRYDRSVTDQAPAYAQLYRADNGFFTFVGFPDLAKYVSQDRGEVASIDAPVFEKVHIDGHSLTVAWNATPHDQLKSITAFRSMEWDDSLDLDGSPMPVAFTQRFTKYHAFSQELQWLGHRDAWNYVGGLYYFGDDGRTNNPQHFFNNAVDYDSQYGTKSNAGAVYGQVDYKPWDPLTLTAGIRYTQERKSLDRIFGCNSVFYPNCVAAPGTFNYLIPAGTHAGATFRDTTPTVSINYKVEQNLNVYVRYASGFKSGGFNGEYSDPTLDSNANVAETLKPFKPEKQHSYEIGAKGSAWNGRLQASTALFYNKDKDLQLSIFSGAGAASSIIRNAADATVKGVELEGAVIPFKGTRLQFNYAYLDAHYDHFYDDSSPPNDVAKDRAFVHTPRNAFNIVLDSELARFDWGTLKALLDYGYTSSIYTYPYQLSGADPTKQTAGDTRVKGYGLLNGRLSLMQIPLGRSAYGEFALWGRNLTDEKVAANFIDFGPAFGSLTDAYFIDPRTYGVVGIVRW
ncbi:MAG TPA: TonB-dependent receptor [Nevskia sp.]|nr:TonB-dependent receptor [Nevskia sp.]